MNKLRKSLQENLMTLLCFDDANAKTIVAGCDYQYFEGDYKRIAQSAYDFVQWYKEAPKTHLDDLIEEIATDEEDQDNLLKVGQKMHQIKDSINAEWTLRQLNRFIRFQQNKQAIFEAAELLESSETDDDLERVDQVLLNAVKDRPLENADGGIFLSDE